MQQDEAFWVVVFLFFFVCELCSSLPSTFCASICQQNFCMGYIICRLKLAREGSKKGLEKLKNLDNKVDYSKEAKDLLSAVNILDGRFGVNMNILFLRGSVSKIVGWYILY